MSVRDNLLAGVPFAEKRVLVVAGDAEIDLVEQAVNIGRDAFLRHCDSFEIGLDLICASLGISAECYIFIPAAGTYQQHYGKKREKRLLIHFFGKVFVQS